MQEIKLYDSLGFGLIINLPTGILFSSQTGGNACLQSAAEGVFVPLANDIYMDSAMLHSPETELSEYFLSEKYAGTGAVNGIDQEDAKMIESILKKYHLHDFITVDLTKLSKSHEAWIWVKINVRSQNNLLLDNFEKSNLDGIITWTNSD